MDNQTIKSVPWKLTAQLVSPGLALLFQILGIDQSLPVRIPFWLLPTVIVIFCSVLLILNVRRGWFLSPPLFVPLSVLLFETWLLWNWVSINLRNSTLIFDLLLLTLTLGSVSFMWRAGRGWIASKELWFLAIITAIAITELFRMDSELGFADAVLIALFRWMIHVIPILTLIFIVLRRNSETPYLLLMALAFEPFLIEKLLGNEISMDVWTSTNSAIHYARIIFQVLPAFLFLVLLPTIQLRARIGANWEKWLLLPICLAAICLVVLLRMMFLQGNGSSFSLYPLAMGIQFILFLISPVVLTLRN